MAACVSAGVLPAIVRLLEGKDMSGQVSTGKAESRAVHSESDGYLRPVCSLVEVCALRPRSHLPHGRPRELAMAGRVAR